MRPRVFWPPLGRLRVSLLEVHRRIVGKISGNAEPVVA